MRRGFSILTIFILVMGGFGFSLFLDFASENAIASIGISGDLTKTRTYSGDIYIEGNVNIKSGIEITIAQGSNVIFNNTNDIITVDSGGSLDVEGTDISPVIFRAPSSSWKSIIVNNAAYANFTWCEFWDTENGIALFDNNFRTVISNCSFNGTVTTFFSLTNSKMDVISSEFEGLPFDNKSNLNTNLGKVNIADETSEVFIEYFIDVTTKDGKNGQLPNINVLISPSGSGKSVQYQGITDSSGEYNRGRATALRVNGTSPNENIDFVYTNSVQVWDKWDGTSKEVQDISRQTYTISNASLEQKNNLLHIEVNFTFDYPPRIKTKIISKIIVEEDKVRYEDFIFQDNDDYSTGIINAPNMFDNITMYITDQNGVDIYDAGGPNSTKEYWISWSPDNDGRLKFYRTIESPFTVLPDDEDYKQKVPEKINITVTDPQNNMNWTSWIDVEFRNVPDKPNIVGLGSNYEVTEDEEKQILIGVSDNDNETSDIEITSDSPYVTYNYNAGQQKSYLILNFENEFGGEGKQLLVNVTATDNCWYMQDSKLVKNQITQGFNVIFHQTPDPPKIIGKIPDKIGNESTWTPELILNDYWSDVDPDDNVETLEWYVTDFNTAIFEVSGANVSANTSLNFNLIAKNDLGGFRNPSTINDEVTIWLNDQYLLSDSQKINITIHSTNQQPSLHKVEKNQRLITVEPEIGDTEIYYQFMVDYKDHDGEKGDSPEYVQVVIDNITYNMNETTDNDDDHTNGKRYYKDIRLSPGIHEHYFKCSDGELKARLPDKPTVFYSPKVEVRKYIKEFKSDDNNFVARIAYTGLLGSANINAVSDPEFTHNLNKGDMDAFFKIEPSSMLALHWIEITVFFGKDFKNYESKWLRKADMQLAYNKDNSWVSISSQVFKDKYKLICNITPEPQYLYDILLDDVINSTNKPIFTVVGFLDADGDEHFNDKDAFPFDPAAREDRDNDGSPGDTEWVPGKNAQDSTSTPPLHEDKFPDDPAASKDNDGDECPDEWNPGMKAANSTSDPPLVLDHWPNDPGVCADTDGDDFPDMIRHSVVKDKTLIEDKDDDNDGIPDDIELDWNDIAVDKNLDYRFDPKDHSDGALDWDGDGRNNSQEYRDNTDPFKKDSVKEDEDGAITANTMMIIGIVIIIIIILLVLVILLKRKKKEKKELPRGMGGPPPEEPMPPELTERVEPPEGEGEMGIDEYPEAYDQEPTPEETETPEYQYEEGVAPTEEPGAEEVLEEEETTMDEAPTAEDEVQAEIEIEEEGIEQPAEDGVEETESADEDEETSKEDLESETEEQLQYTCPNCNTIVTTDMTACPGCQTPLTFD